MDGYEVWLGELEGDNDVPDSCCHEQSEGCGKSVGGGSTDSIRSRIFVDGCMEIIKDKLEHDVVPMMVVYACIGVILAIVELISCVLACAYVAQLNRRTSRTDAGLWHYADANAHTYPDETDRAPSALAGERSSLHDTVV